MTPSVSSPLSSLSVDAPAPAATAFAHASEAEFARILDFYGVRWEYEPHTFPILWNLDGGVAESFSPDFWFPDLELYVELTTLRQSLVRKKNRKLRRLRELYPDVRVKLFYGRDFRALMLKYGKLGLVEGLSGAPGQASLIRQAGASVDEPLEDQAGAAVPLVVGGPATAPTGGGDPLAGPGATQPDPNLIQPGVHVAAFGQAGPDRGVPAAIEEAMPGAAASRSARRRRRRRAAAQLRRRTHVEEPPSQPAARHEPLTRR